MAAIAFSRLLSIVSLALTVVEGQKHVTCATGQRTVNAACCPLFSSVQFIQTNLFDGGKCGEEAHSALRLSFHDAIGFSIHGGKGEGADGSILAFNSTELKYSANKGIDDIIARQYPVFQALRLTAGDFVHLSAAVGTANCPGSPRLRYMFGRPPPKMAAPDLTVPEPTASVTFILDRFADAGFSPEETVALLASHSVGAADVMDKTIPGTPFDSTVGTFDSQFFLEVLLEGTSFPGNGSQPGEVLSPLRGEMRLQSDFAISQDPRTACVWQKMINNQETMMNEFQAAMAKLQVLGQPEALIDCSDVVPTPVPFPSPIKYPASFSQKDVQIACKDHPFPILSTVSGPAPSVSPVAGS